MALKCSPDIAQAIVENVLLEIEDADVYIHDVGAFSNDWNHRIIFLATILRCLHKNGFTINPLKCELVVKKNYWLGYWLTPYGLNPWKKKLMLSFILIALAMPQKCTCSLVE
jgi:hypothetical protein